MGLRDLVLKKKQQQQQQNKTNTFNLFFDNAIYIYNVVFKKFTYVYWYFACLLPMETRRVQDLLELEMVVSGQMSAGNQTWVLWTSSSSCSQQQRHLSSPVQCILMESTLTSL